MLKSIFNATGIPQNIERFRNEIGVEVAAQFLSAKAFVGHLAIVSVWVLVTVMTGLLAILTGLALLFIVVEPYFGRAWALAFLFVCLTIFSMGGLLFARAKAAAIPPLPALKLPALFPIEPPIARQYSPQARDDSPFKTSIPPDVNDPLFNWLFSLVREATPWAGSGDQRIDQLLVALKPQAELVATQAIAKAVDQLRDGDRRTKLAILGTAILAGVLISRIRRHPEPKDSRNGLNVK